MIVLTITKRQLAAFQAAADRNFARRALALLHELWPDRLGMQEPEALEAWAVAALAEARAAAIVSERDVCSLFNLKLVVTAFDPSADWPDWARIILDDSKTAPVARLEALFAEWARRRAAAEPEVH